MTTLQKRRLYFWLGLFATCALLFVIFPWKAVPVILFFLLLFLSPAIEELYRLVVHRPVHTPEYQPPQQPEEYSSYTQGYQEVPYYQPPVHQEAPITPEDQPQAQYPKPQYR